MEYQQLAENYDNNRDWYYENLSLERIEINRYKCYATTVNMGAYLNKLLFRKKERSYYDKGRELILLISTKGFI